MENQQEKELPQELSPEKIKELTDNFNLRIPMLEAQLRYEELLSKIDKERHERWTYQMEKAYAFSQMQQAQPSQESDLKPEASDKRPLKKA